ncbi:hypothetical protein MGG_17609 [Pyricularia oryzae 70-15]|uniref:Uncharacterized protein n=1 Tax=Pyricularia oryzae (strain 70-15 / ATCC MYA-4617 / FGSC 8958) TaxID=242507 RepID=G4NG60_PYRO7|nr:uncharacterized protein MGG_17609 [Pyricularia oryzae 70-15]EHA47017.1 hypothetical protein MGG_17609 [Pyricularia oryzae 70-15]
MSAPIGEKIQPPETAHSSTGYPTPDPDQFYIMLYDLSWGSWLENLGFRNDAKIEEAAGTMIRLLMLPDLRYFHR